MTRKKTILNIDTSSQEKTRINLVVGDRESVLTETNNKQKSQVLLRLIENILNKQKISLKEINGIEIIKGPGSFTGLRVGMSVANTLGWLLNIPINGEKGKCQLPEY